MCPFAYVVCLHERGIYLRPFAWLIFVWPDVNGNALFPVDAHSPFSLYVFCVEGKDLEMNHPEHKNP